MEKYQEIDINEYQRSKKNADLYKEVYGNYTDFEDLPVPDNTNEIDIENFKTLVESRVTKRKENAEANGTDFDNEYQKDSEDDKVYDINTLLERAKEENAKIKKESYINKNVPNYLANLESDKNTKDIILKYDGDDDADFPIVKEQFTSSVRVNEEGSSNLSLDILSDLKPNGDTMVSKPMKEFNTSELKKEEKEFFDDKLNFSNDDFEEDEEFYKEKDHIFLKVLLIILGISIVITGIYFAIKKYIGIF